MVLSNMPKKVLGGTGGFWEKRINKKIGFTFSSFFFHLLIQTPRFSN
jgi:hypothetical protein